MKKKTRRFITCSVVATAFVVGGFAYNEQIKAATIEENAIVSTIDYSATLSMLADAPMVVTTTTEDTTPNTTCPYGHENCNGTCQTQGQCDGTQQHQGNHHGNGQQQGTGQHRGNHQGHGNGECYQSADCPMVK